MTNLVPFAFDVLARRDERAGLEVGARWRSEGYVGGEPLTERLDPALQEGIMELAEVLRPLLTPHPIEQWIASERLGLTTVTTSEVDAIVSGMDQGNHFDGHHAWYEFNRLADGSYVLFPNDASDQLVLDFVIPVRTSASTAQVRRFRLGPPSDHGEVPPVSSPAFTRERCVMSLEQDDPGMPYKGSCEPIVCSQGCTRQVVFITETGDYVLTGCSCD